MKLPATKEIAVLILAHDKPGHLRSLISSLAHRDIAICVHLDKKSNVSDYLSAQIDGSYFIEKRYDVSWGQYSMIEATVALIKFATTHFNPDRYVLLSGSDYPLEHADNIVDFFNRQRSYEFIDSIAVTPRYHLDSTLAEFHKRKNVGLASLVYDKIAGVYYKKNGRSFVRHLPKYQIYRGQQWWALSRMAIEYCLHQLNTDRQLTRFLKNSFLPDEWLFHTLIANSSLSHNVCGSLTFSHWKENASHPSEVTIELIKQIRSEEFDIINRERRHWDKTDIYLHHPSLFIRKFPENSNDLIHLVNQTKQGIEKISNVK